MQKNLEVQKNDSTCELGAQDLSSFQRAEEEKKRKALEKKKAQMQKEAERLKRSLKREKAESEVCNDLQLVFPVVSYEN